MDGKSFFDDTRAAADALLAAAEAQHAGHAESALRAFGMGALFLAATFLAGLYGAALFTKWV